MSPIKPVNEGVDFVPRCHGNLSIKRRKEITHKTQHTILHITHLGLHHTDQNSSFSDVSWNACGHLLGESVAVSEEAIKCAVFTIVPLRNLRSQQ